MKKIDVCLSPELIHLYELKNETAVIVDILRATSCMVTALSHGAASIKTVANTQDCLPLKRQGYIVAGERDGKKVEGFDKGNSPFEYMGEDIKGKRIACSTTNGTQAVERSKQAGEIIIGSFLNLTAVAKHLLLSENNVLVVCAGWKGRVNLEDTLFAGALVELLKDYVSPDCDSPMMSYLLYRQSKQDLHSCLQTASHVKRLQKLNIDKDIEFCMQRDLYPILPILKDGEFSIA